MAQGASGSYAINNVQISQPSEGGWLGSDILGVDGNNRPIYPAVREYELVWDMMSVLQLQTLINFHLASVTGTLVFDLPQWGANDYIFYSYSGTVIEKPQVGKYFQTFVTDVKLIVRNIRA